MRTVPSGNTARISSSPPMALIKSRKVLRYMSVRFSSFEMEDCFTFSSLAKCSWVNSRAARSSSRAISSRSRLAIASERERDSGDIRARNSSNFLAIFILLLAFFLWLHLFFQGKHFEMSFVEPVSDGHEDFIPAIFSSLVAADQQNRSSARIEGVQHSIRPA